MAAPKRKPPNPLHLIIGVCALLYAGWQATQVNLLLDQGVHVQGTITQRDSRHLTIAYIANDGKDYRFVALGLVASMSLKVGDKVDVIYLPSAPGKVVHLNENSTLWGDVIYAGLIGCVFLLVFIRRSLKPDKAL